MQTDTAEVLHVEWLIQYQNEADQWHFYGQTGWPTKEEAHAFAQPLYGGDLPTRPIKVVYSIDDW